MEKERLTPSKAPHTYILHPFDVGLDLLHDPSVPLHLLRALHALVDPLSHLFDVALGVDEERVVGVVLWRVLQQVLPRDRAGVSPLAKPGHGQCHCPSPSHAALAAGDGDQPQGGGGHGTGPKMAPQCPAERLRVRGQQWGGRGVTVLRVTSSRRAEPHAHLGTPTL